MVCYIRHSHIFPAGTGLRCEVMQRDQFKSRQEELLHFLCNVVFLQNE